MNRQSLLLLAVSLSACATAGTPANAPPPAQLEPCLSAPRCVSSLGDDEHKVAPFKLAQASGWSAVVEAVRAGERTTIVQDDAHYLHAEIVSPWHFYTDDLELMLRADGKVEVRSSSRIGYYDFDVNRKRVEALREALVAKGVLSH